MDVDKTGKKTFGQKMKRVRYLGQLWYVLNEPSRFGKGYVLLDRIYWMKQLKQSGKVVRRMDAPISDIECVTLEQLIRQHQKSCEVCALLAERLKDCDCIEHAQIRAISKVDKAQ